MDILIVVYAISYLSMVIYETQGYEGESLNEAKKAVFTGILILISLVMRLLI